MHSITLQYIRHDTLHPKGAATTHIVHPIHLAVEETPRKASQGLGHTEEPILNLVDCLLPTVSGIFLNCLPLTSTSLAWIRQ